MTAIQKLFGSFPSDFNLAGAKVRRDALVPEFLQLQVVVGMRLNP